MHRLVSALGMPQHRFASIHVVGTNGKSSVTRMAVALLEAHGVRAGAYLSPHFERWTERVLIGTEEIEPAAFAAAVERVAQAVTAVNRALEEADSVTQFEVLTAAAFVALAQAGVEVGVIEAGLGGRLDATNVIPSRVTALPSISLEHMELLGETEEAIAAEKLDVLQRHSTLVVGRTSTQVAALAERLASERRAEFVTAAPPPSTGGVPHETSLYPTQCTGPPLSVPVVAGNWAVARTAVEAIVGPLDDGKARAAGGAMRLPGVLEYRAGPPPSVLDAAHNPGAAKALAQALPSIAGYRPVIACIAMLEGKDAEGFARELAPELTASVCTEVPPERLAGVGRPGSVSVPADRLAALLRANGVADSIPEPNPELAVSAARERASALNGLALVTGTHYLLGYA